VGVASWRLGAGRARKEDPVSAVAGVVCRAKVGDVVAEGQPLLELHTDDPTRLPAARAALADAIVVRPADDGGGGGAGRGAGVASAFPLVADRIGDTGS
jgi:thymidine phosphorylase